MFNQNPLIYQDPKPVDQLLCHSNLKKLVVKAQKLIKLNQLLPQCLPASYAHRCHVMNLNEGTLVLQVDGASLATRLRFLEVEILQQIQAHFVTESITKLQFRIRTQTSPF